ncbi:sialin isoform X2 [Bemisia tabaci]
MTSSTSTPPEREANKKHKEFVSCRQTLHFLVFFGFMANYMLRVNLSLTIVEMVGHHPQRNSNLSGLANETNDDTLTSNNTSNKLSTQQFDWNEYEQNYVIGSFYWGYILTELLGGRLSEVIGARKVFGYSMLFSSFITLLTPLSAKIHLAAIVVLRFLLGFLLGVSWPAMHPMAAHWIPPNERSKFIANMMASSLGAAITLPVCGFIIDTIDWEAVFYVTGLLGLVWSAFWFGLVYDTPAVHPRISPAERQYIEESIGQTTVSSEKALKVPWFQMLTSRHVWAIILVHGASVYGFFTITNQLPTYMKNILNVNIKENGLLSSLPFLGKYTMAMTTSTIADFLRKKNKLSVTAIRKLFTGLAVFLPGVLMIVQVYLGQDRTAAVTIFTLSLTLNGAVTAGYLGNGLDIAPNFSGTIFGLANTMSSFGGSLSSFIVGTLTNHNQTYGQWQIVFWMLAGTYMVGALIFVLFGTGELQPWNSPDGMTKQDSKEVIPLKKSKSES